MPVYPFKCTKCGLDQEILMSVSDYEFTFGEGDFLSCRKCGSKTKRVFTSFAIIGGEWNWRKGYRSEINDAPKEIRYDLKRLEESAMEEGNLKKSNDKKQALAHFAEAHQDILEKADLK